MWSKFVIFVQKGVGGGKSNGKKGTVLSKLTETVEK